MNTRRPRTIGSPVSPHSLAKNSAPTPNAAATNVAAPLFTPFEIVPPTNIFTSVSCTEWTKSATAVGNQNEEIKCMLLTN